MLGSASRSESVNVNYDLGIVGVGLLILLSLGFGFLAQIVGTPGTSWDWLAAGLGFLIGGLVASEMVFGGQVGRPVIDGLSFDATLIGGGVVGLPVALVLRLAGDRRSRQHPASA
jgi:hypothetical protein